LAFLESLLDGATINDLVFWLSVKDKCYNKLP
jgi:hypothetical protein